MLRELACLFPEVLDSLAAADSAVAAQTGDESDARRLSDRIYPPPSFDPEAAKREAEALLDGPRRETLDRGLAWWLRDLVGRPQPETDAR